MSPAAQQLGGVLTGAVVIVGIGSRGHGDDEAGLALVKALRGQTRALLVEAEEVPESYLGGIIAARPDTVLFVDAVDFGGASGEVGVFLPGELKRWPPLSTHRLPLRLAMDYLAAETQARLLLLGIQPDLGSLREGLSGPVRRTVAALADLLQTLLGPETAEAGSPSTAATGARESAL